MGLDLLADPVLGAAGVGVVIVLMKSDDDDDDADDGEDIFVSVALRLSEDLCGRKSDICL